jgi:hypothetical protein
VALDASTGRTTRRLTTDEALAALDEHAAFWGMSFTSTIDVLDHRADAGVCCDSLLFGAAGERPRWPVTLGDNAVFDAGYGITSTTTDDIGNGVHRYPIDDPQPCSFLPQGMCPEWVTPINGTTATVPCSAAISPVSTWAPTPARCTPSTRPPGRSLGGSTWGHP